MKEIKNMKVSQTSLAALIVMTAAALLSPVTTDAATPPAEGQRAPAEQKISPPDATKLKDIKAYCIDFNWMKGVGRWSKLATPGTFGASDPATHLAWYKMMGCNVIQTFCVSTVGYAWYKNGFVPEQPGLKHDYLRELVKLGHAEGMCVFGYFTIGCNPRWAELRPDQCYGGGDQGEISGGYHVVYTDEYLEFLSKSIADAVSTTGIDGFMIDWLWQPSRTQTGGKWIEAEKKLYQQLMGDAYPGDDQLTLAQELTYSRKALLRAWRTIRKAAKDANPKCVIWLTVNNMTHPHVLGSEIYQEMDWLMNEAGDMKRINEVKETIGEHTRLITCMAAWTGVNATEVVPQALKAGVGLYGFSMPYDKTPAALAKLLAEPVWGLKGDDRNVATLARAYNGVGLDTVRTADGEWVQIAEPKTTDESAQADKPNIVVLSADDMAWTDTSMLGSEYANTPNLAKLADSGVLFTRGYVPTPLSRASLMTLITGLYTHEHGTTMDDQVAWIGEGLGNPEPVSTINRNDPLPRILQKQGYLSFQSGRWFEGYYGDAGFTHGTSGRGDRSYDHPGTGDEAIKACTDFIDMAQEEKKPFLLLYAPALPAFNLNVQRQKRDELGLPESIAMNQKFILTFGGESGYLQFQDPNPREDFTRYFALVEWFDAHCGQLIDYLEQKGLREKTLIVYQSANGWVSCRRRGNYAPRTKGSPYDGGVRSPLIVSWPAKIKPAVSAVPVSSIDIVPTLLAASGAELPKKALPGIDLLPLLEGKADLADRPIFGESYASNGSSLDNPEATLLKRWVVQGAYKLILSYDGAGSYFGGGRDRNGGDKVTTAPELFDLVKDPYEQNNLYAALPKVADELRKKIDGWYELKERTPLK